MGGADAGPVGPGLSPGQVKSTGVLGVGVAESAGLIKALIRKLVMVAPPQALTYILVFIGIISSIAADGCGRFAAASAECPLARSFAVDVFAVTVFLAPEYPCSTIKAAAGAAASA